MVEWGMATNPRGSIPRPFSWPASRLAEYRGVRGTSPVPHSFFYWTVGAEYETTLSVALMPPSDRGSKMSRKVSQFAARALLNGARYSNGKNTKVENGNLYLHGNHIARNMNDGHVEISNRGWFTLTTKDRLNAIPTVSISQKRGVWYLNGHEWSGEWVNVAPDGSWTASP